MGQHEAHEGTAEAGVGPLQERPMAGAWASPLPRCKRAMCASLVPPHPPQPCIHVQVDCGPPSRTTRVLHRTPHGASQGRGEAQGVLASIE